MKDKVKGCLGVVSICALIIGGVACKDKVIHKSNGDDANKGNIQQVANNIEIKEEKVSSPASRENLLDTIVYLCKETRKYGTEGDLNAQEYLIEKLNEYGYKTEIQTFPIYKRLNTDNSIVYEEYDINTILGYGSNIIGTKVGEKSEKKIILCAHYDSTSDTVGVIDNASGTATVLELARCLEEYNLPYTIEIIFYGAEEVGCAGSMNYVEQLSEEEKEGILGVINIDMIGEKNGNEVTMGTYYGRPNLLTFLINDYLEEEDQEILPVKYCGGASDDYHFFENDIPAFTLNNKKDITVGFKEYDEQLQYLDFDMIENVIDGLVGFLVWLDNEKVENNEYEQEIPTYMNSKEISNDFLCNDINDFVLTGFKVEDVSFELIADGASSEIIYKYSNEQGEYYEIIQVPKRYINNYKKNNQNNIFESEKSEFFEIITGNLGEENLKNLNNMIQDIY